MKLHSRIYGWDYVWRDFAEEMQGEVTLAESKGKETVDLIRIPVDGSPWTLTYAPRTYKKGKARPGTTATAAYQPKDGFSFAIYNEKWSSNFGKLFGLQDIEVGDAEFDEKFIVQGSDKVEVLDLFSNVNLRDLILMQPALQFRSISDPAHLLAEWNVPEGFAALAYSQHELTEDFDHLRAIYDLMVAALRQLCAIGAVDAPGAQTISPLHERSALFRVR